MFKSPFFIVPFHLLLFCQFVAIATTCAYTIARKPSTNYTDFYDLDWSFSDNDEVEYFDPTQTTAAPQSSVNKGGYPVSSRHPENQIGSSSGSRREFPQPKPSSFSPPISPERPDFGSGVFLGPRRNQFVEVRIGEFSPTEPFARVYGKLSNYSSSSSSTSSSSSDDGVGPAAVLQVSEFLGVPFAEPPVKHLRFQRPILRTPPDELLALQSGNPCPQMSHGGTVIGSEDCLYLSIFVPTSEPFTSDDEEFGDTERSSQMPVLVWFHGESPEKLQSGQYSLLTSGSAQDLDPYVFLQRKIIVVTPHYRIGSLGYLSVSNEDLNGNVGLFDMVLALEWVQRYITYFGGDSAQVTVMGQGSTATALGLLSTSTAASTRPTLFHRIILMSGAPTQPLALDTNEKRTYLEVARQNNCPSFPTLQLVRCLQKKSMESLVTADEQLSRGKHLGKWRVPLPVIQKEPDNRFVPPLIFENPSKKLFKGSLGFEDAPLLIGVTNAEMSGFLPSLSGKPEEVLKSTILGGSSVVLRQFIREILTRSEFPGLNVESVAQLVAFEYFAGLNITDRQEQAKDLVEEMLSDYLFYMPALTMAKAWSLHAPVYFYVYDHVFQASSSTTSPNSGHGTGSGRRRQTERGDDDVVSAQAAPIHGSDLEFLTQSYKGSPSAQDRYFASVMVDTWTSFIHKGSPLQSGVEWPTYTEDVKEYLLIGDSRIQVREKFRSRQELFWTELLKQLGEKPEMCSLRRMSSSSDGSGSHYNKHTHK